HRHLRSPVSSASKVLNTRNRGWCQTVVRDPLPRNHDQAYIQPLNDLRRGQRHEKKELDAQYWRFAEARNYAAFPQGDSRRGTGHKKGIGTISEAHRRIEAPGGNTGASSRTNPA